MRGPGRLGVAVLAAALVSGVAAAVPCHSKSRQVARPAGAGHGGWLRSGTDAGRWRVEPPSSQRVGDVSSDLPEPRGVPRAPDGAQSLAPASASSLPQAERDALIAFYTSTSGATWVNSTGWLGAAGTECSWFGITCDGAGDHVTELNLPNNGLKGTLADLTALGSLTRLALNGNRGLTAAPVPAWITTKTSLTYLTLSNTRRNGAIPDLSALSGLQTLSLASNPFAAGPFPAWLTSLTGLTYLNLQSANRTGDIPDLSALMGLQTLALDYNYGLNPGPVPDWIAGLPALTYLGMAGTNRTGAPPSWLAAKASLTQLDLYGNQLTGTIPTWIGGMTSLTYLNLSYNQLTGPIPSELGNLVNLTRMDLDGNQLSGGLPASLGNLVNIQNLYLEHNPGLSGAIPPEMGNMAALRNLYLGYTGISGPIPTTFANLTQLRILRMESAALTGSIPNLSTLTNLTNLALWGNPTMTAGPIPGWLGGMTSLVELVLSDTNRTGAIPDLSTLVNLQWLHLNDNEGLTAGPIPSWLNGLPQLRSLGLSHANRTGDIPTLAGLVNLEELDLGNNPEMAAGPIPSWLGALTNLRVINLSFTNRSSDIPDLSALTSLETLDLLGNRQMAAGPVPAWLAGNPNLVDVELGYTNRTGDIPDLSAASELHTLVLDGNPGMTPGPIPSWLAGRPPLRRLGLCNRTGEIPDLGASTGLVGFSIESSPGLTPGPIPAWLTNLPSLRALALWNTNRTGDIPDLSASTHLGTLVLKDNPGLTPGPVPAWVAALQPEDTLSLSLGGTNRTGAIPDLGALPLDILDLSDNPQLDAGAIPAWITGKTGLIFLWLSNSNRTGTVPAALGNLTNLLGLALASNRLTGELPPSLLNLTHLGQTNPYLLIDPVLLHSDLRWNALHTADPTLKAFLDSKQTGGDWESTQTVAPAGVAAGTPTESSVRVSWTPIPYGADFGGYTVSTSTHAAGPYTPFGSVTPKSAGALTVTGLAPSTPYFFRVETFTNPHGHNRNTVVSEPGDAATASTTGPLADLALAAADWPDPVHAGSTLTYTLTVTNLGSVPATEVTVIDTLPAGVTLVSALASQGSCSGTTTVTCDLTTVAGGAHATVLIAVTPASAGTVVHTATVTLHESDPDPANNTASATTSAVMPVEPLPAVNMWTPLGPDGGLVLDLKPDPLAPGTVWASTIAGVHKTTDGGAHWARMYRGSVAAVAPHPTTPGTVFLVDRTRQVYKSADGGATWTVSSGGLTPLTGAYPAWATLRFAPGDPTVMYLARRDSLFRSADSGASWTPINTGALAGQTLSDLLVDPATPGTLVVSLNSFTPCAVHTSTDGGDTWAPACSGLPVDGDGDMGVRALAQDPDTPTTLYAGSSVNGRLYRSVDGGASWTIRYTESARFTRMVVRPGGGDVLYAAATDNFGSAPTYRRILYRSADGGATWSKLTAAYLGAVSYGSEALALDPADPDTLYLALQDGIYRSSDAGSTWSPAHGGLRGMAFEFAPAFDPLTPATWYAHGGVNGIFKTTDGGATFQPIVGGLTDPSNGAVLVDPHDPQIVYSAGETADAWTRAGEVYDYFVRSTDGGATWRPIANVQWPASDEVAVQAWGLVALPTTPTTIFAASPCEGVFKSTDGGLSFLAVNAGLPFGPGSPCQPWTQDLVGADPAGSTLFLATMGGLFASTDGGSRWFAADAGLPAGSDVRSVVVDPTNILRVLAGTGTGVYASADGGWSWTPSSAGLPPGGKIYSLAMDPTDPDVLYAAWGLSPDTAVYRSLDGGSSWSLLVGNAGLDAVHVWRVAIDPANHHHLVASTRGGLYQITLDGGDADIDGVAGSVEAAVPSPGGGSGDGNGDGTPDAGQANVTSLPTADGAWATLAAPEGTTLAGVRELTTLPAAGALRPASPVAPVFAYTISGAGVGGSTTLELVLPRDPSITTYRSFGPSVDNLVPHWFDFMFDGQTGAEIVHDATRTRIVLHLLDGGRGDTELVADGVISGPHAPAPVAGDANGDWAVSVGDVFYLINTLFAGGPAPAGPADVNGDHAVNVQDVFYLINYLFAGGPAPV